MPLIYSPFQGTDADYEARVQIANAEGAGKEGHVPDTVEDMRFVDAHRKPGTLCVREFALLDGERIGIVWCVEEPIEGIPDNHAMGLSLLPEFGDAGLEAPIFEHLLKISINAGGRSAVAYVSDRRKGHNQALRRLGFECVSRDPRVQLDLRRFDAACFASAVREAARQGIAIRSVPELEAKGVDWAPHAHELCRELVLDVPALGHLRTRGIEEFRKQIGAPWWFPESYVVAIDGDQWVGQTGMIRFEHKPTVAMTDLTGVIRTHRGRGIATAVKVKSLQNAKQAGVRFVDTDNAGNDPMRRINIRLGFEEIYATMTYRKKL
jgi:GNAT superfamily N-acetyltransferase